MPHTHSRWTLPILRMGMGLFLAAWGLDKVLATEGGQRIFESFYGIGWGPNMVQVAGAAEILLGLALAVGLLRVFTAWVALVMNVATTVVSWKQILDPWGVLGLTDGGAHLFLASIVVLAVSIVLVLDARDDTLTLDRRLGISPDRRPADHGLRPAPGVEGARVPPEAGRG